MKRRQVLLSALGLMLAAAAVRADVPKTVKILGQNYTVIASPRTGVFKNGVTVNLQKGGGGIADADVPHKACLAFAPGGTPDADRLYVGAAFQDDPGPIADGFYMLQGTDANGAFTLKDSSATVFWSGNKEIHGRIQNMTWISDDPTPKARNFYMFTYTTTNMMRWYHLQDFGPATVTTGSPFRALTLFLLNEPSDTEQTVPPDPDNSQIFIDPNAPSNQYEASAIAPNGMQIVAGQDNTDFNGDATLGVIDPVKGTKFFPVKTDLVTATGNKFDPNSDGQIPMSLVHVTGDEYLMIGTAPDSGINATEGDLTSQTLYRLKITLPADLANGKMNSIKAEVLGTDDLPGLHLGQSPTQKIQSVALGREVAAGKPILYMADWAGNIFTLRPAP
jgi:hypothetical protein